MFVGRPYCRWLCPYGGAARRWRRACRGRTCSITPDKELDCGLCAGRVPVRRDPQPARRPRPTCVSCARCYESCPLEIERRGGPSAECAARARLVQAVSAGRAWSRRSRGPGSGSWPRAVGRRVGRVAGRPSTSTRGTSRRVEKAHDRGAEGAGQDRRDRPRRSSQPSSTGSTSRRSRRRHRLPRRRPRAAARRSASFLAWVRWLRPRDGRVGRRAGRARAGVSRGRATSRRSRRRRRDRAGRRRAARRRPRRSSRCRLRPRRASAAALDPAAIDDDPAARRARARDVGPPGAPGHPGAVPLPAGGGAAPGVRGERR